MIVRVEDNENINVRIDDEEIGFRTGEEIVTGSDNYEDLKNKPQIEGVTLIGDVSLEEIGAIGEEEDPTVPSWAKAPNKPTYTASEVHALPDTTYIPELLSDLINDEGFITLADIPPLVTDLGYIDPEPYEEDVTLFFNTLTKSGFYKFTFGGDDLTYFVAVQSFYLEDSDITLVNQHYWGDEEGPITEYIRAIVLEDDEVVDEQATSYMTMEAGISIFAPKSHVHYRTASASMSVWDYCEGSQISFTIDSPILYTDLRLPRHAWLIETTMTLSSPSQRFIRLTDLHDASVIYQRSGTYSSGSITWGYWIKFSGTVFTP